MRCKSLLHTESDRHEDSFTGSLWRKLNAEIFNSFGSRFDFVYKPFPFILPFFIWNDRIVPCDV